MKKPIQGSPFVRAPASLLQAGYPIKVSLYLFDSIRQEITLCHRRGEMIDAAALMQLIRIRRSISTAIVVSRKELADALSGQAAWELVDSLGEDPFAAGPLGRAG